MRPSKILIAFFALHASASASLAAPLSCQDFMAALMKGAKVAEKESTTDAFLRSARPGLKQKLSKSMKEDGALSFTDEDFSLLKADLGPQVLVFGGSAAFTGPGGMAVWKRNVFPTHFYLKESTRLEGKAKAGATLRKNLSEMPWFSWDEKAQAFSLRRDGASEKILELLGDGKGKELSLYRGTTPYEAALFELDAKAAKGQLPKDWQAQLEAALEPGLRYGRRSLSDAEALVKSGSDGAEDTFKEAKATLARIEKQSAALKSRHLAAGDDPAKARAAFRACLRILGTQGSFLGIFTAPSEEYARWFAKGKVLKFEFPRAELQDFVKAKSAYAGFEFTEEGNDPVTFLKIYKPSVEVAFFGEKNAPAAADPIEALFRAYRGAEDAEGGAFN